MKQCPNCRGNVADYVPVCPYCGVALAGSPAGSAQPAWSGSQQNSGKATASMVCGILFFFWPFTAIAAVVLGHIARMAANEASAVGTLRTYNTALVTYATECQNAGYPKALENLGPGGPGPDKCAHADLVNQTLATQIPVKSGYNFYYRAEPDLDGRISKYVLAAVPVTPNTTGVRHFFTDQTGVIRSSMSCCADANSAPLM